MSGKLGLGCGGARISHLAPHPHGNRPSLPQTTRKPGHLGSYYLLFSGEAEIKSKGHLQWEKAGPPQDSSLPPGTSKARVGWLHRPHPSASHFKVAEGPSARIGAHWKRLYLLAPPPDGWFPGSASQEMLRQPPPYPLSNSLMCRCQVLVIC